MKSLSSPTPLHPGNGEISSEEQPSFQPNPYEVLPSKAFWRTAVADKNCLQISELWDPKWPIEKKDKIATAGSCFAQNMGRALQARGYKWIDGERAPPMMSEESRKKFNYGIFSFRTGNIYTAALLRQWVDAALNNAKLPNEVWEQNGRFFDPLRPQIEPDGFVSISECLNNREITLRAIEHVLKRMDIFVFTMGLTEAWIGAKRGVVYPACPGTLAGQFDSKRHILVNYAYPEIMAAMTETLTMIKAVNPSARFLLTVSPVPMTATAIPGRHILTANTYSKSTLRAVAGALCDARGDTDYFPGYEIISTVPFRGMFYQSNLRQVAPEGVDFVMKSFMQCLDMKFGISEEEPSDIPKRQKIAKMKKNIKAQADDDDVVCEEALLESYNAH